MVGRWLVGWLVIDLLRFYPEPMPSPLPRCSTVALNQAQQSQIAGALPVLVLFEIAPYSVLWLGICDRWLAVVDFAKALGR